VLYNAVLSGVSLDGEKYFYANYLATDQQWHRFEGGFAAQRQEWFGCACCPPNYARQLASIGAYAYSVGDRTVSVHLYTDSTIQLGFADAALEQKTRYPWDGRISLAARTASAVDFALRLRLPGWCSKPSVTVNGKRIDTSKARQGISHHRSPLAKRGRGAAKPADESAASVRRSARSARRRTGRRDVWANGLLSGAKGQWRRPGRADSAAQIEVLG